MITLLHSYYPSLLHIVLYRLCATWRASTRRRACYYYSYIFLY